jgi:hypothetical protein
MCCGSVRLAEEGCSSALHLDPTHVKVGGWCAEERVRV